MGSAVLSPSPMKGPASLSEGHRHRSISRSSGRGSACAPWAPARRSSVRSPSPRDTKAAHWRVPNRFGGPVFETNPHTQRPKHLSNYPSERVRVKTRLISFGSGFKENHGDFGHVKGSDCLCVLPNQ